MFKAFVGIKLKVKDTPTKNTKQNKITEELPFSAWKDKQVIMIS